MPIVDFHSHILPGIDDGSKNIETSLAMLRESAAQNVDIMVATPHFHAENESIATFLKKREKAYESILQVMPENMPRVLLGAEVTFFKGISHAERVSSLVIQDTNILLLEMPFSPWKTSEVEEVKKMIYDGKLQIMLAHLDRFMKISQNKHYIRELLDLPVIVQMNADSLINWKSRKNIIKLLSGNHICVLGSDCHDMRHRLPNLIEARAVLKKKTGDDTIAELDSLAMELLSLS